MVSRRQKVSLPILDQPQKTLPGGGIRMIRDEPLPQQGVADLTQVRHQPVEYVFSQPVVKIVLKPHTALSE